MNCDRSHISDALHDEDKENFIEVNKITSEVPCYRHLVSGQDSMNKASSNPSVICNDSYSNDPVVDSNVAPLHSNNCEILSSAGYTQFLNTNSAKYLENKVDNICSRKRREPMGSENDDFVPQVPLTYLEHPPSPSSSIEFHEKGESSRSLMSATSDMTEANILSVRPPLIGHSVDSSSSTISVCQNTTTSESPFHLSCDDFRDALSYRVERLLGKKVVLPSVQSYQYHSPCSQSLSQDNDFDGQLRTSYESHDTLSASTSDLKFSSYKQRTVTDSALNSDNSKIRHAIFDKPSDSVREFSAQGVQSDLHSSSYVCTPTRYRSSMPVISSSTVHLLPDKLPAFVKPHGTDFPVSNQHNRDFGIVEGKNVFVPVKDSVSFAHSDAKPLFLSNYSCCKNGETSSDKSVSCSIIPPVNSLLAETGFKKTTSDMVTCNRNKFDNHLQRAQAPRLLTESEKVTSHKASFSGQEGKHMNPCSTVGSQNLLFSNTISDILRDAPTLLPPSSNNSKLTRGPTSMSSECVYQPTQRVPHIESYLSPTSVSSFASTKPLEWDSGADIGYAAMARDEPEGFSVLTKGNQPNKSEEKEQLATGGKCLHNYSESYHVTAPPKETMSSQHPSEKKHSGFSFDPEGMQDSVRPLSRYSRSHSTSFNSISSCDTVRYSEREINVLEPTNDANTSIDTESSVVLEDEYLLPPSAHTNKYLRLRPVESTNLFCRPTETNTLTKLSSAFQPFIRPIHQDSSFEFNYENNSAKETVSTSVGTADQFTNIIATNSPQKCSEPHFPNISSFVLLDPSSHEGALLDKNGRQTFPAGKLIFMESSSFEHLLSANQEENPHIRWYPFNEAADMQDIKDAATQTSVSYLAQRSSHENSLVNAVQTETVNKSGIPSVSANGKQGIRSAQTEINVQTNDTTDDEYDAKTSTLRLQPLECVKLKAQESCIDTYYIPHNDCIDLDLKQHNMSKDGFTSLPEQVLQYHGETQSGHTVPMLSELSFGKCQNVENLPARKEIFLKIDDLVSQEDEAKMIIGFDSKQICSVPEISNFVSQNVHKDSSVIKDVTQCPSNLFWPSGNYSTECKRVYDSQYLNEGKSSVDLRNVCPVKSRPMSAAHYHEDNSVTSSVQNIFYTNERETICDTIPKEAWLPVRNIEKSSDFCGKPPYEHKELYTHFKKKTDDRLPTHIVPRYKEDVVISPDKNPVLPLDSQSKQSSTVTIFEKEITPKLPMQCAHTTAPCDYFNCASHGETGYPLKSHVQDSHFKNSVVRKSNCEISISTSSSHEKIDIRNALDIGDSVILPVETDSLKVEKIGSYDGFPLYIFKPCPKLPSCTEQHGVAPTSHLLHKSEIRNSCSVADDEVTSGNSDSSYRCIVNASRQDKSSSGDKSCVLKYGTSFGSTSSNSYDNGITSASEKLSRKFVLGNSKKLKQAAVTDDNKEAVDFILTKEELSKCFKRLEGKISRLERQMKYKRGNFHKKHSYCDQRSYSSSEEVEAPKVSKAKDAKGNNLLPTGLKKSVDSDEVVASPSGKKVNSMECKKKYFDGNSGGKQLYSSDLKTLEEISQRTLRNHRRKIQRETERLHYLKDIIAEKGLEQQSVDISPSDIVSQSECTVSSTSSHFTELHFVHTTSSAQASESGQSVSGFNSKQDAAAINEIETAAIGATESCDTNGSSVDTETKFLLPNTDESSHVCEVSDPKTVGTQTSFMNCIKSESYRKEENFIYWPVHPEGDGVSEARSISRLTQKILVSESMSCCEVKHLKSNLCGAPVSWIIPLDFVDDGKNEFYSAEQQSLQDAFKEKCQRICRKLDARRNLVAQLGSTRQRHCRKYIHGAHPQGYIQQSGTNKFLSKCKESKQISFKVTNALNGQASGASDSDEAIWISPSASFVLQKRTIYLRKLRSLTTRRRRCVSSKVNLKQLYEKYRLQSKQFSQVVQKSALRGHTHWPSTAIVVPPANSIMDL